MNPANTYHINRFWTIEPSGTLTGYSYDIDLNYLESDINGSGVESTLLPVKKSNDQWYKPTGSSFTDGIEQGTGLINTTSNLLTWNGLSTFSKFGATGNAANPLPVELVSFTADCNDGTIDLNWKTISEKNSLYYIVEKSTNALDWKELKQVEAAGNSNAILLYQLADNNDTKQTFYYRIKMVDINGEFKFSNIIKTDCFNSSATATSYPNPSASNSTFFIFNQYHKDVKISQVQLFSVEGKELFKICKNDDDEENNVEINYLLNPGIYYLKVTNSNGNIDTIKHVVCD
jgi:hypothetical protein